MFEKINLNQELDDMDIIKKYHMKIKKEKHRSRLQHTFARIISTFKIPHTSHEYDRAIGNAIKHGGCPVKCEIYIGNYHQMICVIKDSGKGFDYKDIIKKMNKGEVYYHYHGAGFRYYNRNKNLNVDWRHHGKEIILFYNP